MEMGFREGGSAVSTADPKERPENASVAEILRLLSAGAPGAILLALGDGPMRTKVLTQRVRGYTARTIYRHIPRLVHLGLVERKSSSTGVLHSLTPGTGSELCDLIERFAAVSRTEAPGGQVEVQAWSPLGVLADLWEAGVVAELSCGPRSPTELAQTVSGLSYHQLSRRAGLVNTAGFLCEVDHEAGQRRCYGLTRKVRRTMGLIAGIGRWRDRHRTGEGDEGMGLEEMATVLRASLPLVALPAHRERRLSLYVVSGDDTAEIGAEVCADSAVRVLPASDSEVQGWAEGDVGAWEVAVVDGRFDGFTGGDKQLVGDCLRALHAALWAPVPFDS